MIHIRAIFTIKNKIENKEKPTLVHVRVKKLERIKDQSQ